MQKCDNIKMNIVSSQKKKDKIKGMYALSSL